LKKLCAVHLPISSLDHCFLSSLYILVINPLSDVWLAKIFSYSVGCLCNLVIISFVFQKTFSFM
jgi:hypothetical protein